jgi:hypothetical protein
MADLTDAQIAALAGIAASLGTAFNKPGLGAVANASLALARLLEGNGPTAADVAAELRAAVEAHEERVFRLLQEAAEDDGA